MAKINIIHSSAHCSGDCAGCMSFQPTDDSGMPECTRPEPTTTDEEIRALCGRGNISGACPQVSCENCPDFCRV